MTLKGCKELEIKGLHSRNLHLYLKIKEGKLARLRWDAIFLLVCFFQMFFAADHRFLLQFFIHKNHN